MIFQNQLIIQEILQKTQIEIMKIFQLKHYMNIQIIIIIIVLILIII